MRQKTDCPLREAIWIFLRSALASLGACLAAFAAARAWPQYLAWVFVGLWLVLSGTLVAAASYLRTRSEAQRKYTDELAETRQRIQEIQLQKRQEQLNALQSQINPHFLYNTLDTIRGLSLEVGAVDVSEMVATLSTMFKYSMDYDDTIVTVNDELENLRSYLKIQPIRFPNRFEFRTVYDCELKYLQQVRIPKLVLQPVVENMFAHGFKGIAQGGKITVRFIASDTDFTIILSDNGVGIKDNEVAAMNRMFRENGILENREAVYQNFGIALKNIDSRVKMYFGERFGLRITSTPGYGTDVTLLLPMNRGS